MMKTFTLGFLMLLVIKYVSTDTKFLEDSENRIRSIARKVVGDEVSSSEGAYLNGPTTWYRPSTKNKFKNDVSSQFKALQSFEKSNMKSLKQIGSSTRTGRKKRMGKKRQMLLKKRRSILEKLKANDFANSQDRNMAENQLKIIDKKLREISMRNYIRKTIKKTDIGKDSKITFKDGNRRMEKSLSNNTKLVIGEVVMLMPSTQADSRIHSIEMKVEKEGNDSDKHKSSRESGTKFPENEDKDFKFLKKNILWEKLKSCHGQCEQLCINGACYCRKGYRLMKDNVTCLDINECSFFNGYCHHNCTNLMGSHECTCSPGYHLDMKHHRTCHDINECHSNNGHGDCQDKCHNTIGNYYCTCENLNGTRLSSNNKNCADIDECSEGISGCSHTCINYYNSYRCDCPQGWKLGKDDKTCEDIDECQEEEIKQKCVICKNIPGSYICPLKIDDIPRDEPTITCPRLHVPDIGYFDCNRTNSIKFKEYPRELLLNSIGAICELICPIGDSKMVYCNASGKWTALEDENIEC